MACIELQAEGVSLITSFSILFSFYQVILMGYKNFWDVKTKWRRKKRDINIKALFGIFFFFKNSY